MLALTGAVLGLLIAVGGVRLLISLAARYSPRANEIRLDGMVLGFTLLLSIVVAVLLSYAPKLAKEGSLAAWVAAGVNRMSGGVRRQRLQRGLVVAQIAVSVILLTGAGLADADDAAALRGEDGPQHRADPDDGSPVRLTGRGRTRTRRRCSSGCGSRWRRSRV